MKPVRAKKFKRDVRKAERRGKDLNKLKVLVRLLAQREALPARYQDHLLTGTWAGCRDARLEPDWIVIYRIEGNELHLVRTGSHADIFRK